MDEKTMEKDFIDIDVLDTIGGNDLAVIPKETGSYESDGVGEPVPISDPATLKTGNIVAQVFNLISQSREKDYWKLDDSEIKSLNKTCPKIIPKVISEHSGIISCVLNILGIIIKRLKKEREDSYKENEGPVIDVDQTTEVTKALTGGRSG